MSEEQYRAAWKDRGRELNRLFDILGPAVTNPTWDPEADLSALVAERDALRAAARHVTNMAYGYPQLETFYVFWEAMKDLRAALGEET